MGAVIFLILFSLLFPARADALYDPQSVANNRFGVHIADVNDITDVAGFVNSSGGDWGYVTVVIEENDRTHGKWQELFNTMRRLHLIPLIRLATTLDGAVWKAPNETSIPEWVDFLNGLNWPTENRYIILFNEPNHAKEWGGDINAEEYAQIAVSFARALKLASEDFFILPAGLDASAGKSKDTLDEVTFLRRMVASEPDILSLLDGWTSHAYPNPDFQGKPGTRGRGSLGSFLWELAILRSLGMTRDVPVFITETGWTHREGKTTDLSLVPAETVSSYVQNAAQSIWQDPHIAAITPFIFNYQDIPFDHFSFRRMGNNGYYPHYDTYRELEKIKGEPKQRHRYVIKKDSIPKLLVTDSHYVLTQPLTNTGQGILDTEEGFAVALDAPSEFTMLEYSLPHIEPNETGEIVLQLKTPVKTGRYPVRLLLKNNYFQTVLSDGVVTLVPPPALNISLHVPPKTPQEIPGARVTVSSGVSKLHVFDGRAVIGGNVFIPDLTNVVPGQTYDITVELAGYFTKSVNTAVTSEVTYVPLGTFFPFDANGNGSFDIPDLGSIIDNAPFTILRYILQ